MKIQNRVIKNVSWIVCCKIIQSLLSLIVGVFTARYLGPSNYGLIQYAASLVAFALPLMQLGFNETLVQEFISHPSREGTTLGTVLLLNVSAGIASIIGVVTFSIIANPNDKETIVICFLYSLTLIFQAAEMTQYWFQAKLMSKYTSISALLAHAVGSLYKIYLLVTSKSLVWFAITHAIEACIIAIILICIFYKKCDQKLSFSITVGKEMLSRSRHYISSALMIVVFQQTDKIMLKSMLGETAVGYYSASITCMAITGFLYTAIIDSARPWVLAGSKINNDVFHERFKLLSSIIILISFAQGIIMTIFSKQIVFLLFGNSFMPTSDILRVAVWYISFGNMGTVRNIWILANDKQKYLPVINLSGAILNIIANFLLIPLWGGLGAAVASFVTQLFSNFILCFIIKPIRKVGHLMVQSFNIKLLFNHFLTNNRFK